MRYLRKFQASGLGPKTLQVKLDGMNSYDSDGIFLFGHTGL